MIPHGTHNGYTNHKCRCELCREANRVYKRAWTERNRESVNARSRVYKAANAEKVREERRKYREQNREAIAERTRARRLADRDAALAREAAYREANREAIRRDHRKWREANPELVIERTMAWAAENPERRRAANRRRRARLRSLDGGGSLEVQYAGVVTRDPCSYCGAPSSTVDHIVPLHGGGDDLWTNYTGACLSCNSGKGTKSLLEHLDYRMKGLCPSVTPSPAPSRS